MHTFFILEDDPLRIVQFQKRIKEWTERTGFGVGVCYAKSFKEATRVLPTCKAQIWLLDHDLGGTTSIAEENTGSEFIRWVLKKPHFLNGVKNIIIHSLNPVGANNMVYLLRPTGKPVYKVPSLWQENIFHKTIR